MQAIGGFYLLPSSRELFYQDMGSLVSAGLFLDTVPFPGLLVPDSCLQISVNIDHYKYQILINKTRKYFDNH